jgi:hypothetical protein
LTASPLVRVAAAGAGQTAGPVAGLAGFLAGAISVAAGEHAETADPARKRKEQANHLNRNPANRREFQPGARAVAHGQVRTLLSMGRVSAAVMWMNRLRLQGAAPKGRR